MPAVLNGAQLHCGRVLQHVTDPVRFEEVVGVSPYVEGRRPQGRELAVEHQRRAYAGERVDESAAEIDCTPGRVRQGRRREVVLKHVHRNALRVSDQVREDLLSVRLGILWLTTQ